MALNTADLGPYKKLKSELVTTGFKAPGTGQTIQTPDFCRVELHSSLSFGSSIKHEVWLPANGWNGRLLGTGNSGWAGSIRYRALAKGLEKGFATANTDLGTAPGADGAYTFGDPVKWLDYGQRATHDMTASAKALITAFYGQAQSYSYFEGCSTGGFQGLRNAELFPADYDGIVAGHPGDRRAAKVIAILRNYMQPKLHPEGILPNDKLMMMHNEVLKACAGQGGGLPDDPFVAVPTACTWQPKLLLCGARAQPDCLTRAQVEMAEFYYRPWIINTTRAQVFPGLPRGTELGWAKYMEAAHEWDPPHASIIRSILGASLDFRNSDWDRDVATYLTIQGELWGDTPPKDPAAFRQRGGKMLVYFGLNDTSTFYDVAEYYEGVQAEIAKSEGLNDKTAGVRIRESIRLFTLPGVEHCGGGNGPNTMDPLTPLMTWVEKGVPPERIEARWVASSNSFEASLGRPMSRPICAYPQIARYVGHGRKDKAESFRCAHPELPEAITRKSLPPKSGSAPE
jgi:feruloyl esterase